MTFCRRLRRLFILDPASRALFDAETAAQEERKQLEREFERATQALDRHRKAVDDGRDRGAR